VQGYGVYLASFSRLLFASLHNYNQLSQLQKSLFHRTLSYFNTFWPYLRWS
jgi:hypothetical protein